MKTRRLRRAAGVGAALTLATVTLVTAGAAYASFDTSASSPGTTATTKRIFPGTRTVFPSDLRDASSGSEANASDALAVSGDGRTMQPSSWASSFSSTRYLDFDYPASRPGGLSVSPAAFNFAFASTTTATTCFYFEVRARAANTVVAAHGSAAAPVACASTTLVSTSTPLPEITTTDRLNDLRVRVYENNSAGLASVADLATVSASTPYATFTLNVSSYADASSGTPATVKWPLASAGDGSVYGNQSNWKATADATRYYKFTFPAGSVPSGATVTGTTLSHTYKDQGGVLACNYFEVYSGSTLLATHGSSQAGYCNATSSFVTDTVSLPEVTTPAAANALVVKMYVWDGSVSKRSQDDLVALNFSYYLN